jgi:hypothetical protein
MPAVHWPPDSSVRSDTVVAREEDATTAVNPSGRPHRDTNRSPPLPDAVHELIDWLSDVAYAQGYHDALTRIATAAAELDATWKPIGRRNYETLVAQRVTLMENHARRLRAELDLQPQQSGASPWPPVARPGADAP